MFDQSFVQVLISTDTGACFVQVNAHDCLSELLELKRTLRSARSYNLRAWPCGGAPHGWTWESDAHEPELEGV